jgi:hypothetical protein
MRKLDGDTSLNVADIVKNENLKETHLQGVLESLTFWY